MASDIFTHVPHHVTLLFLFLCSCQVFLVMHLNSLQAPARAPARAPAEPLLQVQRPSHGKLRLLWSLNTSNDAWDQTQKPAQPAQPAQHKPRDDRHKQPDVASYSVLPHYQQDSEEPGSTNFSDYSFNYIINQPYICQSAEEDEDDEEDMEPVYLLVLIHSHPSHKPQRDSIRATWGKQDYSAPVRFVFILGESESDPMLTGVRHEARLYRDMVLGNFTDTYRNLTVKALFGLQWTTAYCPNVKYILKTDDDTYFNTTRLQHYLTLLPDDKPLILGSLNSKAAVARRGLWQVNHDQFSAPTYPGYCSGCAYVLSRAILEPLLKAARTVPLLPIEDVYVTGMLADETGSRCQSLRTFPYWSMGPSPRNLCMLLDSQLFGVHNVNYERMYYIHNKMRTGHTCTDKTVSEKNSIT